MTSHTPESARCVIGSMESRWLMSISAADTFTLPDPEPEPAQATTIAGRIGSIAVDPTVPEAPPRPSILLRRLANP